MHEAVFYRSSRKRCSTAQVVVMHMSSGFPPLEHSSHPDMHAVVRPLYKRGSQSCPQCLGHPARLHHGGGAAVLVGCRLPAIGGVQRGGLQAGGRAAGAGARARHGSRWRSTSSRAACTWASPRWRIDVVVVVVARQRLVYRFVAYQRLVYRFVACQRLVYRFVACQQQQQQQQHRQQQQK